MSDGKNQGEPLRTLIPRERFQATIKKPGTKVSRSSQPFDFSYWPNGRISGVSGDVKDVKVCGLGRGVPDVTQFPFRQFTQFVQFFHITIFGSIL